MDKIEVEMSRKKVDTRNLFTRGFLLPVPEEDTTLETLMSTSLPEFSLSDVMLLAGADWL